ncbi:hypothetical protein STAFG_5128 [Streptomyces afghaniensis 772]|uniref:Uncharacterized protein n=1 Tax=Streptomyces afghaniensis 772 TaxID=1283301 RepID=S4MMF2_9ACTN|nr:hypothetical protein STAFG_5128 [Streptomyces afghaniensis 772]
MIQPQFGGAEPPCLGRVGGEGAGAAAHAGDDSEVGGDDRALPALPGERRQGAGAARAGHDHTVRDGQDVRRVDPGVGADVVGHRVRVQQHLEALGRGLAHGPDRRLLERAGGFVPVRARGVRERLAEELLDARPAAVGGRHPLPHRLQRGAYGGGQLVAVQAVPAVALPAGRAEAQRHQVLPGVAEADAAGLVVGVQMLEAVPAEGLQFGAARPGPYGRLRRQVGQVRARGGLRDARRPGVAVAVGVDDRGARVLGAQTGVVREDDPGVHLQAGVRERGGGLAEGVTWGPVTGRVGVQLPSVPAVVRRVVHGGVLGGDDAVARVAGGERARGVVGGGERHLLHAERRDPRGRLRVPVDVPGVDECRRLHLASSSSA